MFIAVLVLTLFSPIFFPTIKLLFFVPYLIVLFYRQPYFKCLWGAFFCGLIMDLLSAKERLGLWALNYTLTSIVLYKQRLNFFGDRQSTLPIMTLLFSLISTGLQWVLLVIFEEGFSLTLKTVLTDLVAMPLIDAIYAYLMFVLPWVLFSPPPRRGSDYFA